MSFSCQLIWQSIFNYRYQSIMMHDLLFTLWILNAEIYTIWEFSNHFPGSRSPWSQCPVFASLVKPGFHMIVTVRDLLRRVADCYDHMETRLVVASDVIKQHGACLLRTECSFLQIRCLGKNVFSVMRSYILALPKWAVLWLLVTVTFLKDGGIRDYLTS